jgi:hypothetical protein
MNFTSIFQLFFFFIPDAQGRIALRQAVVRLHAAGSGKQADNVAADALSVVQVAQAAQWVANR